MNGPRRKPSNMGEVCRLCLAEDEITSPIFGEEDSSSQSQIPLSFRIMACVSVEVSESDGLPKVICDKCLYHVNSWHEFKQICDLSQATLKEWQNNAKENSLLGDKDVIIKQEPEDPEPEEDIMEIIDDPVNCQFVVEDIKQEVDMYGEEAQDRISVEAVDEEECLDPLGMPVACTSNSVTKEIDAPDVEVVPQAAGDVCHLRITDIKTECGEVIPVGDVSIEPTEGRLLRSVLQGKAPIPTYAKKVSEQQLAYEPVKPFNCRLCDKSFSYAYLLKRHQKTHKGDRNVCAFCQKGFSTHASLVQHVRFFNGVTSSPYTCDHCQQEFACRTQYLSHADGSDGSGCSIVLSNRDHPQEVVEELQDGSVQCDVCGEKFSSLMLLRLHVRKEHLQFSCHKCDKSYTNGVALSNHLRSHSLGGIRHHCKSCTRTFPTFELLKKHERTHMKENAAMTIIPADIVSKSSDYDSQEETNVPLSEIAGFLDRPIKVEPPDSPEVIDDPQPSPTPSGNATSQQSHVCHLCNEHFPTIASLRFHLKGVHLHYQCHRCPKVYSSGVALSNHLRSHSLGTFKKHKCLACLKSFSSLELLTKHKRTHTAPGGMQSFSVRTRRLNHLVPSVDMENHLDASNVEENEIEDLNEPLAKRTCTICNLVAASPSALGRHMACHTKEKMYTCSICHVSMSYASSLQKHYRLIHNKHIELRAIQKNSVVEDEVTPVPEMQEAPELDSGKIETTRSGRRIIFKKTFKMTSQLQQAQLPLPFECKVCHRRFQYRSFLLRHSKVHSKVPKLPKLPKFSSGVNCPICFKTFPDAKALNNHKGVHTRFKHFSCNICGKSFNGLNAWQKHERMHQKGFVYSCKLCGKKFISKSDLHEHKKMHIKLKIYTCAVCKNSYHSSSALGKHKRRHGHWYASPENSEVSDLDIVNGYDLTVTKAPVIKAPVVKPPVVKTPVLKTQVFKSPVVKTPIPRSLITPSVNKALSKNVTHFPSGKRRPYCGVCHKTFSHLSALRRHKRLHALKPLATPEPKSNPNPVETAENACLTCNRTFPDHVSLVRHKGWHTRRGNVVSPDPGDSSPPGKLPINPLFVKTEPASNHPYQCPLCHKTTFTTGAALASHIRSHANHARNRAKSQANHAEPSSKAAERKTENWKANSTAEKSEVLTSPRRLACKICKKPFESKKALITHIGWHSRDSHMGKPFHSYKTKFTSKISSLDNFSCNVCHKIFSSAVTLSQHKKLHTRRLLSSIKDKSEQISELTKGGENYSCSECNKSFKLEKYLLLHMRLHTGEKRFQCNLCPQAYHRSGSLWKHKRTHHNVKVFSCPICQKRFGLKIQLTKHIETHQNSVDFSHTDTVFACSRCDKTFTTLVKYKQHERVHHV